MKNKVLILSVGRKVSLIKAFREAGWIVYGQDMDKSSIALEFCDEIYDINEDPKIDLIIPTRDAEIKDAWIENGWDTFPVNKCLDKFEFYKWCKQHGFKTPEVYFCKPRISKSGKEVEVLYQEMLGGEEYSVDVFSTFSGNVISAVPRIRLKVQNGESCITKTISHQKLLEQSIELAEKLGLVGHSCLQCFLTESSEIFWTDVNARFGGASIVGIRAGCKSPEYLLRLINGESLKPDIGNYKVGLVGRSYTDWVFQNG